MGKTEQGHEEAGALVLMLADRAGRVAAGGGVMGMTEERTKLGRGQEGSWRLLRRRGGRGREGRGNRRRWWRGTRKRQRRQQEENSVVVEAKSVA